MSMEPRSGTDAAHPYPLADSAGLLERLSKHPAIWAGDVNSAAQYIVAQSTSLLTADYVDILLAETDKGILRNILRYDVAARRSTGSCTMSAEAGAQLLSAMTSETPLVLTPSENDPRMAEIYRTAFVSTAIASALAIGIRIANRNVGLIIFQSLAPAKNWTIVERTIARSASGYLALAYANQQSGQIRDALRISEARLGALTDNLPGALYQRIPTLSAPFIYISSCVSRFCADLPVQTGLPGALGWSHFVHPDDISRVADAYAAADTGSEYALEYRVRHPDGGDVWVLDRGRGRSAQDGTAVLDGMLFNITPRKKAEQKAEAAASLQNAILENVSYSVISTDAKGTITFFNRAAEKLLGYRATELIGRQTPLIFHDLTEVQSRMQDAKRRLGRDILYPFEIFTVDALGGQPNETEWTYLRKDGHRLTVRLSVTAIHGDDGEVTGFLGIASDVSDRKALTSRLRQSEEIAARILLQSPDAILITSIRDGRIVEANPGFEQITGITRAQAIGHSTIELGIWADLDERNAMIDAIRKDGEVTSLPIRVNQRGGNVRLCAMWARLFTFDGEPALLSVVHDVTDLRLAAQAARDSEAMLQAVLDTVPSHVFWKDADSRYLGCNRQFALDNGFDDPAQIVGTTDYDQLTDHSPQQIVEIETVLAADRQIIATGKPDEVRNAPFIMQDGTLHWMRVTKAPLRNTAGEITGVLGVQHDVTELLSNERAAKDAEKMLQTVLDAIPSRVFWKDRNSVYLGCNRPFLEDAGQTTIEDVIGKTDNDLPWRDKTDYFRLADQHIISTGIPQIGTVDLYEMPDGPPRWFEVSKLPLIDADGKITGVLGIGSDVTEQRAAVEQLRANEEKLRSLFESSPLGVTLTSVDGLFMEVNDAFLNITGYNRTEIDDLRYQALTPPEYAASDAMHAEILARTGRYGPYDKEYIRKDGTRIAVSLNGSMVSGPDGKGSVWSTIEDITLRRAAENAQRRLKDDLERLVEERTKELKAAMEGLMRSEKLASLGSLVAGVAHEISTPVGNASLATSTMVESIGEFENQMREKITRTSLEGFIQQIKAGTDIANRNIERVANLIQNFKQVAVDQTSSQRRIFHVVEIVDEIVTTMQPSLKRSAVQIETFVSPDVVFDSYPGPLGQILTNLINNCLVHAFPENRPGVIRLSASQHDDNIVQLKISDDGVGIPPAALSRVFDPFYTSKLGSGGSGLGLHIVHNIATTILDGTISVASNTGRGTTFTLLLPNVTPISPNADE